jgi:competence protein ComEA
VKSWQALLLGIFMGFLTAGLVLLVSSKPIGQPVSINPPPTSSPLVIYLTGAVNQPGVYQLPANSRINDALLAAGGSLPEADLSLLNLAALVHDGERIWVPGKPEPISTAPAALSGIEPAITPTLIPPSPDHLLNINSATQAELDMLPGIGPTRAQDIITYRQANGLFASIEDLMKVSGIGPGIFANLNDLIAVQPQP